MKHNKLRQIADAYIITRDVGLKSIAQLRHLADSYGTRTVDPAGISDYLIARRSTIAPATYNLERSRMRSLIRFGQSHDMLPLFAFPDIAPAKKITHEVIFLTLDELRAIALLDIDSPTRSLERDRFLFQCLTGLRDSDLRHLTADSITTDRLLKVTTIKTGQAITIPLNDDAAEYFASVISHPIPSTPTRIKLIQQICKAAGIDTPVTITTRTGGRTATKTIPKWSTLGTHTARRTFICNLIASGTPLPVIMRMTGHTSVATINPYLGADTRTTRAAVDTISLKYMTKI